MSLLDLFRREQASPVPRSEIQGRKKTLSDIISSLLPSRTYNFTNENVQATPTPTPTPEPRRLALENYPTASGQIPEQPPANIEKIIWDVFGPRNEATQSAAAAWAENATSPYDPSAYGWNAFGAPRGTEDLGTWQINTGFPETGDYVSTLTDLLRRRKPQLDEIGVRGQQDLYDPLKNALVAEIIRQEEDQVGSEPWGRWYGWKNKGMELNK